jgi:hydroxymethylpyrimidine pyrophosphatase-like HAD family hydrolase
MRFTAVALDFDGTIAHDSAVPAHVVDGLERLRATGRKLMLVTGRELEELLAIFPEIAVFERVVAENGALLYCPAKKERRELGEPPPQALVDLLTARGVPISVGHSIVATVEPHETVVLQTIRELGLELPVIFNKGAVMILPPGINKASGLKVALEELGLSARNLVAAGDAENDHALLDAAEYSVAVANAIPSLKSAADRVTREPRGDGVLEVIADLIESDLAKTPAARERRTLLVGKDAKGIDVRLPTHGASVLVAGAPRSGKSALTKQLLLRLCAMGYQFCVLDSRGEYLDFEPAVIFGTHDHAPDPIEILSALEKPGTQAVVCLEAVPVRKRSAFFEAFSLALHALREKSGRPHWLVADEAQELVPRSRAAKDELIAGDAIYVTADPAALANPLLAAVDVVAAMGPGARHTLEAYATALPMTAPPEALHAPDENETLLWWRRKGEAPRLATIARATPAQPPLHADVGKLLRHAESRAPANLSRGAPSNS